MSGDSGAAVTFDEFKRLLRIADRRFGRVRDLAPYAHTPLHVIHHRAALRSYAALWDLQRRRRLDLAGAGLRRSDVGDLAVRIAQLYYALYIRTSDLRFIVEAFIFYEAVVDRGYFSPAPEIAMDLITREKELRVWGRFMAVAMLLDRKEVANRIVEGFRDLVEDLVKKFPETDFKEWKKVLQQMSRFLKATTIFPNARSLRYSEVFDVYPSSVPYIARYQAKRTLTLQHALLTSCWHNQVKYIELTLDTFRMIQCLEWELNQSLSQRISKEPSQENALNGTSGISGFDSMDFIADLTELLLPNPQKTVLYHPSVSQFIAAIGTICEEMSSEGILLIYVSASGLQLQGKVKHGVPPTKDIHEISLSSSKLKRSIHTSRASIPPVSDKQNIRTHFGSSLSLNPRGIRGLNYLYPEDLIPFTRKPLFLVIDSDNSHAFKIVHGAERGETSVLLLSHERPVSVSGTEQASGGSQFTYFLTAPLQAFCELVGLSSAVNAKTYINAQNLLSATLEEWELLLFNSKYLHQAWTQVLSDSFLRRLILRFIFCRAILFHLRFSSDNTKHLPECFPDLPESLSPSSSGVLHCVYKLAECFTVLHHFHFRHSTTS